MGGGNYDALLHAAEKSSAMKAQTREEREALERTAREEREQAEAATREAEVRGCGTVSRLGGSSRNAAADRSPRRLQKLQKFLGAFSVVWVRCGRRSG